MGARLKIKRPAWCGRICWENRKRTDKYVVVTWDSNSVEDEGCEDGSSWRSGR